MSQQELVGAYLDGRISRRTLVRRLVAAGVSLGAAASYAQLLSPERARAGATASTHYPELEVRIRSFDLSQVVADEKLVVKVTADETINFTLYAYRVRNTGGLVFLGSKSDSMPGPDTDKFRIPLTNQGVNDLSGRPKARVRVYLNACDLKGYCAQAIDERKLIAPA